jgi:hypothetical protein
MAGVSRLAKLRAMSLREIASRSAYRIQTSRERALHRRGLLDRPDRLRQALAGDLRHRGDWQDVLLRRERAGRFFDGLRDGAARADFLAAYPDEARQAREIADRVADHEIEFFGERFRFGERIDWHADPVTKAQWPRTYHQDVPIGGGDRGFGDVKYVWELNRHQFLMDLAKVVLIDGSTRHREALQRLVLQWQEDVPYATGAPWACALEPAFRAWSWLWAYHFLRAAGPLDPGFHAAWLSGFHDHGRFLHRHLETYASPYNHLVGEASALFALGLLFPEFAEAPAWVARGRRVLESTVDAQFYSDGGTVEQSTFYHHATLGFYLLAALLGRLNGVDLSEGCWRAIERAIAFSMAIMQPDGRVPRIGGADDGKPIRLQHLPFFDFRPYQALGAVLFSRRDFRFAAGRFWEDALWVLGHGGADAFARLAPETPPTAAGLPASGYYVVRSSWSADGDYLCFDCGPQAGGLRRDAVPSAAHGHADCLSVVVMLGGREVLVDPGFFCYNGEPEWEVYFRRTGAHNTVVVDGIDQAQHVSKMAWIRTYVPRTEGWRADGSLAWARGSHDGYARLPEPVLHRRTAWLRPDGYVILYDEVTGAGRHEVEFVFQFAPGDLSWEAGGSTVALDDRFELAWAASGEVAASVSHGGPGPSGGWVVPSLGVRSPASRLSLTASMSGGRLGLLTVVADRRRAGDRRGRRVTTTAGPGLLHARVAGDGFADDVYADPRDGTTAPGIRTDAPLAVVRRQGQVVLDAVQAGGTHVSASIEKPLPHDDRVL